VHKYEAIEVTLSPSPMRRSALAKSCVTRSPVIGSRLERLASASSKLVGSRRSTTAEGETAGKAPGNLAAPRIVTLRLRAVSRTTLPAANSPRCS